MGMINLLINYIERDDIDVELNLADNFESKFIELKFEH